MTTNYAKMLKETSDSALQPYFQQLVSMWREMGPSSTEMETRLKTVESRIVEIVQPMVECEQENVGKIKEICQDLKENIDSLWRKLKKPGKAQALDESLTLIEQQKELKTTLADLEEERKEILKNFRSMIEMERCLAHKLGMKCIFSDKDTIPGEEEVAAIKENIQRMVVVKEEREIRVFAMKEEIVSLIEKLGLDMNATSIFSLVDGEDPTDSLKASDLRAIQDQMKELRTTFDQRLDNVRNHLDEITSLYLKLSIHSIAQCPLASGKVCGVEELVKEENMKKIIEEMERLRKLKRENLQNLINESLSGLEVLWDKSMTGQRDREDILASTEEESEESLRLIELKTVEMESYLNTHNVTLKKVAVFQERCQLADDLKKRMEDPNRLFKSRGNAMAKEEQDRKKVNQLPELKEEILLMAEQHGNIMVYDVPLSTMVENYYGHLDSRFSASDQGNRAGGRNKVAGNKTLGTTRSGRSFASVSVAPKNKTASPRSFRLKGRLVTSPGNTMMRKGASSRSKMVRGNTTLASPGAAGRKQAARRLIVPQVQVVDSAFINNSINQTAFAENVPYNSTMLAGGQSSSMSQMDGGQDNTMVLSGHMERLLQTRNTASIERKGGKATGGDGSNKDRRKLRRSNSCSDIQLPTFRQRLGSSSRKGLGPIKEVVSKLPVPASGQGARGKENRVGLKRTKSSASLVLR